MDFGVGTAATADGRISDAISPLEAAAVPAAISCVHNPPMLIPGKWYLFPEEKRGMTAGATVYQNRLEEARARVIQLETAMRALIDSITHPQGHDWLELRAARIAIGDPRRFDD